MNLPGSHDMRRLAECVTSIRWWALRPDPNLVASPNPLGRHHIAAARSDAGDLAVLYLPSGGRFQLDRRTLKIDLAAAWLDPRTGDRIPAAAADGANSFAAPDREDWLLLLTSPTP
jgi:hypothetical protein